ncbi:MAG: hypothetical protein ACFFB3_21275 [Candidatus Hodarchaeota archaeon]
MVDDWIIYGTVILAVVSTVLSSYVIYHFRLRRNWIVDFARMEYIAMWIKEHWDELFPDYPLPPKLKDL